MAPRTRTPHAPAAETPNHRLPGAAAATLALRRPAPRRVGRYELRGLLGAGAFGTVHRAFDPQLGREVALKVAYADPRDAAARQRFLREAEAAAGLRHPHIVPVYEAGET